MIKPVFLLVLPVLSPYFGLTQSRFPVVRVHAYKQIVYPGTIHAIADEEGKLAKKKAAITNDLIIYLETRNGWEMTPVKLWLKDDAFDIRPVKMKVPVIRSANGQLTANAGDTLVPFTGYEVWNLALAKMETAVIKSAYLKKALTDYQAIIEYKWKNKSFYLGIKEFKQLAPVYME